MLACFVAGFGFAAGVASAALGLSFFRPTARAMRSMAPPLLGGSTFSSGLSDFDENRLAKKPVGLLAGCLAAGPG